MNKIKADSDNALPSGRVRGRGQQFLYYVAQDLIDRYGKNLSEVTIVFPGKRAQLYMNTFLSHIAQGPVWAPRFRTIDELFQQFSTLTPSDTISNVCLLHRIYSQLVPNPEPLDVFYSWGEILMNDFDDIDKHMVPADKLFTNAADLLKMDSVDFLSDEQVAALRQFFSNFSPERQSELKRRFMEMWQVMPEMYRRLKDELRQQGLMYKGALYRDVIEKIKNEKFFCPDERSDASVERKMKNEVFAFCGFNVLDEVEEALFCTLRDAGQALFYWDYDVFYASQDSTHEAGLFLRHNLKEYPNALPDDIFDNLSSGEKQIHIISTSTDNAQARYLSQWTSSVPSQGSAIVLCDEALMHSALHALPDGTQVNITMGYPLTDTAINGYLSALIDLQVDGYNAELGRFLPSAVERLEKNPFYSSFPAEQQPLSPIQSPIELLDWLIAVIEALGKSIADDSDEAMHELYSEATFQAYRILGQFRWLVSEGTLNVSIATLRSLIRQALASASIPFHGEMDEGIQLMGLLEARNLDFRHLIMLSVGEGIIPRRANDTSLIPYILRAHFGLDTVERQDAVYAYSFYRLLQRADDITLVYNEHSSGASQREQSRFLRQLLLETSLPIKVQKSDVPFSIPDSREFTIEKDEQVMKILLDKRSLSPTAINQYIECPMRFYFRYIAQLRIPLRPQDGIDAPTFGTIFHDTCENFYNSLCEKNGRKQILRSDLEPFIQTPSLLAPHLDEAFGELPSQSGVNMIIRDVIQHLVVQLLKWDMEHTPFTIYDMETDHYTTLTVPSGNQNVRLSIGGRIDRMDIMDIDGHPTLRVVDYKTGKFKPGPPTIEAIFESSSKNAHAYYFQTFLYSLIMSRKTQLPVAPCLFYVLAANDPQNYDPTLHFGKDTVLDIRDYAKDYSELLERVVSEIYDPSRPFVQSLDDEKLCEYCDFRRLCGL